MCDTLGAGAKRYGQIQREKVRSFKSSPFVQPPPPAVVPDECGDQGQREPYATLGTKYDDRTRKWGTFEAPT